MNDAALALVGTAEEGATTWPLTDGAVLGRSPAADIPIDVGQLSRAHARFQHTPSGWTIVDLGSHNGTFVDGRPLGAEPCPLNDGDQIVFAGALTVRFVDLLATPMAPRIGRLHGLWIDPETSAVWVDAQRLDPPLSDRQLDLLRLLESADGELVDRGDIVAHVWRDVAADGVSDQAIDALIKRVRSRLSDLGDSTRIEVVRGRGLRLVNPQI